jgi:hypothetical protein
MSKTQITSEFYTSQECIPEQLRETDTSNLRYLPAETSDEVRAEIERLSKNEGVTHEFTAFVPKNGKPAENQNIAAFLDRIMEIDDKETLSRASSRAMDKALQENIGEGIIVARGSVDEVTLQRYENRTAIDNVIYESMPTEVYANTTGGFSLAKIRISAGDPEEVEGLHVHNGGRLVIALSQTSRLIIPANKTNYEEGENPEEKEIILQRGNAIWMPPWMLHSFQRGDFLAVHPSEAGFEHREAFINPKKDNSDINPENKYRAAAGAD